MSNAGFKNFTASVALTLLSFATLEPATAQSRPGIAQAQGCESKSTGGDLVIYSCPLVAKDAAQRFSFVANFGGSHDDTKLSLQATLNGVPAICEPGSKASSRYEDGDIRLDCRIALKAAAGTRHVLAVRVQWYHAQLSDVQLIPE